jgi:hypothetical protein
MAQIVLGIGASHGPSIQTQPEGWARLADSDTRDPRFDYQALLKQAPPNIDEEITIDVQRRRYKGAHAAIATLTDIIAQAELDVVVVVSNPHRIRAADHHPVFGIFRAAGFPTVKRSDEPFDPNSRFLPEKDRKNTKEIIEKPGCADLSNHLIETLIDDGFDMACTDELPEGATLDDAFVFPHDWLFPNLSIPMVPLMVSRDLPNQATPKRCHELGTALRPAIESWGPDKRVGLIASGGLSHQVVDEKLDQTVINGLVEGDAEVLWGLNRDTLNRGPGTPEILNWIAVAGAMAPTTMTLVDYLPCYRSVAGTGHGITFGYWM